MDDVVEVDVTPPEWERFCAEKAPRAIAAVLAAALDSRIVASIEATCTALKVRVVLIGAERGPEVRERLLAAVREGTDVVRVDLPACLHSRDGSRTFCNLPRGHAHDHQHVDGGNVVVTWERDEHAFCEWHGKRGEDCVGIVKRFYIGDATRRMALDACEAHVERARAELKARMQA